jgi:hypothetical protein
MTQWSAIVQIPGVPYDILVRFTPLGQERPSYSVVTARPSEIKVTLS